ncbi:hypothetical protein [Halomonas huangheensis]|uniref:Uncharacterized protein n=1 Tax=Halomonas huangheensis TaxID=1178482 RepID=W1N5H3_9GAMM|nr:hypothetical protein [Halomonas huangheensis]ALM54219.1 hypothetical protein AR456_19570 [Halomonas huangheensis]ERL50764.1 hypothetical protein BJB45_19400 [Halomonas huangheensis]
MSQPVSQRRARSSSSGVPAKEPIRKPWIWIVIALIIAVSVPWYWPPGTLTPIVMGLPLWALIAVIGSVALCAFLSWACLTQWSDADDDAVPTKDTEQE